MLVLHKNILECEKIDFSKYQSIKNENEKQYGNILLCGNQTSILQISLFEIVATLAQLAASIC